MFESIHFKGLEKSKMFGYAAELPFFKGRKSLEFKPGLNILFGGNGTGKSTVLRILAETMCATQGGVSVVTESALRDAGDVPLRGKPVDAIGLKVMHDGQPVVYSDPRQTVGLIGGGFDYDFMDRGVQEATGSKRLSHGQNVLRRGSLAIQIARGTAPFPTEIVRKVRKPGLNSHYAKVMDLLDARLAPKIERGQPSLLLDEPEVSFSIDWQFKLWHMFTKKAQDENTQVIVASHSVFCLGIPGANYIEIEKGAMLIAQASFLAKADQLARVGA